jgi:predicted transposase/invertase (TIGR01784 family)
VSTEQQLERRERKLGFQEGIQLGREQEALMIANNMLKNGYSIEQIKVCTDLPHSILQELSEEID